MSTGRPRRRRRARGTSQAGRRGSRCAAPRPSPAGSPGRSGRWRRCGPSTRSRSASVEQLAQASRPVGPRRAARRIHHDHQELSDGAISSPRNVHHQRHSKRSRSSSILQATGPKYAWMSSASRSRITPSAQSTNRDGSESGRTRGTTRRCSTSSARSPEAPGSRVSARRTSVPLDHSRDRRPLNE